ncbi:MAG: response regulator [Candidatus Obscuribacterales bacterium]|nr:response regulator [Candidatus Obscuribacterales bacterium]
MNERIKVLLVEDNVADSTLILEVFENEKIMADVTVVRDGVEAIEFLKKQGVYVDRSEDKTPDMVILDLNLPRMDGRELLRQIKNDPTLETIPVVILTTSAAEEDVNSTYKLGANCYVTKPLDLDHFVDIVKAIDKFWFSAVRFPHDK